MVDQGRRSKKLSQCMKAYEYCILYIRSLRKPFLVFASDFFSRLLTLLRPYEPICVRLQEHIERRDDQA